MNILTIDTSDIPVVGVVAGNKELARVTDTDSRHHAERLTPMVKQALAQAGIERPDMIVAGTGPAPFTGLRAGLVTARTLAFAWDVPLVGVSSLEIMAAAALADGASSVVVATDARRRELYVLVSTAENRHGDPEIVPRADFADFMAKHTDATLVVPREGICAELEGATVVTVTPEHMARLALRHQEENKAGASIDTGTTPQYLRRPDAVPAVSQPAAK